MLLTSLRSDRPIPRPRRRTMAIAPFAALCAVGAACAAGDPEGSEAGVSVRDSAGMRITTISDKVALQPAEWHVAPEPAFAIGTQSGEILFDVRGARGLPDGNTLVLDGSTKELRIYDDAGRRVKSIGREGKGPGEFVDPELVQNPPGSNILVFDRRLLRIQEFPPDMDGRPEFIDLSGRWLGFDRRLQGAVGSTLLVRRTRIVGGERALVQDGLQQIRREFGWFSLTSGGYIPLDTVTANFRYQGRSWHGSVPFRSLPTVLATAQGALITHGDRPEIRRYDLAGALQQIISFTSLERPISREMRSDAEVTRALSAGAPLPDHLPAFSDMRRDGLGNVWAQLYSPKTEASREWIVLDGAGLPVGSVRTPAGVEVTWIGQHHVVGVKRDEWGVETVQQHRLTRPLP